MGDVIYLKIKKQIEDFSNAQMIGVTGMGNSFNKSVDLLDTLSYCPEDDCEGLTYGLKEIMSI